MPTADADQRRPEESDRRPAVQCDACQAALDSHGRDAVSFLLLDHLTVPLVGCDDHLERFASVCGLTTDGEVDLLDHRPAGGIGCPGCRLALDSPDHPMVSIDGGAVVVLACSDHGADVVERFRTGRETRQQLTTSLDTS